MTPKHVARLVLALLTAAVCYHLFADGGLRNSRAASTLLGDLPRCETTHK
jgi:hypothetical protein